MIARPLNIEHKFYIMYYTTLASTRYSSPTARLPMPRALSPTDPSMPAGAYPLARLTERERMVLALIAEGRSNKEIAQTLYITIHTVKAHVSRILYKLAKESRTEAAVLWATSSVILPPPR